VVAFSGWDAGFWGWDSVGGPQAVEGDYTAFDGWGESEWNISFHSQSEQIAMADKPVLTLYMPPSRYSSRTWTFWPVAIHGLRALAVMGIEWTTLDFIEHAPLLVRFSTFVVSCLSLGVIELRDWLNFKLRRGFAISLAAVLVLYVAIVGLAYWQYGETPTLSSPIPMSASPAVAPVVQNAPASAPTKLLKKYSEAEKEDLRNATREVSRILDGQGADVAQKTNEVFGAWSGLTSPPQNGSPSALEQSLDDLVKSIITLREPLREYSGPLQPYRSYADDISPLLSLSWQSNLPNPIDELARSVSRFQLNVSVLDKVTKYHDKDLLNSVRGLDFGLSDLQAKQGAYLNWLQQTKERIAAFRRSSL
jgi:hypothetical protein